MAFFQETLGFYLTGVETKVRVGGDQKSIGRRGVSLILLVQFLIVVLLGSLVDWRAGEHD